MKERDSRSTQQDQGMMKTGVVKIFRQDKGFGFIQQDDRRKDLYFHRTGLLDQTLDPYPTDKVSYRVAHGERGPYANDITITEKGAGGVSFDRDGY